MAQNIKTILCPATEGSTLLYDLILLGQLLGVTGL
jgi:hypothetical protein